VETGQRPQITKHFGSSDDDEKRAQIPWPKDPYEIGFTGQRSNGGCIWAYTTEEHQYSLGEVRLTTREHADILKAQKMPTDETNAPSEAQFEAVNAVYTSWNNRMNIEAAKKHLQLQWPDHTLELHRVTMGAFKGRLVFPVPAEDLPETLQRVFLVADWPDKRFTCFPTEFFKEAVKPVRRRRLASWPRDRRRCDSPVMLRLLEEIRDANRRHISSN